MKGKLHPNTTGLLFGAFFGLWHLVWALLVASDLAQGFLDWMYSIHFLENPFFVAPFDLMTAVTLVVVTSFVGYMVGWVFASLWNTIAKK